MSYEVIVVGGGAAGMFASIVAAEQGSRVLLLESNNRLGKKLLITGKGRCNVTNNCTPQEVLQNIPRNGRFLYSALNAFTPEDTIRFFESSGCSLKTERGNRVFPQSDKSLSVLECLQKKLRENGVTVMMEKVRNLITDGGSIIGVATVKQEHYAPNVILATGGVSYPSTGSTGDGYTMASALGHTIIPPEGSLVPLEAEGNDCQEMQGLSLRNVGAKLVNAKEKTLYKDFGELLFTHFGISGPIVLSASAHMDGSPCKLLIDLKPALDEDKLNARILRDLEQYQNRSMENALTDLLPRSLIPVILAKANISANLQANSLKKEQRRELIRLIKAFPVAITGKRPVAEAIITSGGIKTSEMNPKTMESKLVKGLYFAGEIIDCDAYTGGFNLQIAWSTAYVAATAIKNDH